MNGDLWQRWAAYWRRLMPGASRKELERRIRESIEGLKQGEQRTPASRMYGENLVDTFSQWNEWLRRAAAWAKRFQKEPPWEKITGSEAWQGLTKRRW